MSSSELNSAKNLGRCRPWYHFVGVGGSGMSALAQFHALGGNRATGSDRAFDLREREQIKEQLIAAGIEIFPQDGSGLATAGGRCDGVIYSTAVEDSVPDFQVATEADLRLWHRSELLARYVAEHRTIAVTGTSGKSTVTAMVFTILDGSGRKPSLLTGGNLVGLQQRGLMGNAFAGDSDLLVIEADESDGSLVQYEPWAGVLLNLRLDHKPPAELAEMFTVFRGRTRGPFLVGEDENLREFRDGAVRFGTRPGCDLRAERITDTAGGSEFSVTGIEFSLPLPGRHNVTNAMAAIAACRSAGIELEEMVAPLANFSGVARRFQTVGQVGGIEVVDDFAHNPDKITAALKTAQARLRIRGSVSPSRGGEGRVLAIFQPHGFGPTRFLKDALIEAFARQLTDRDRLWMPEIFYAGGTVTRDISSRDITDAVAASGKKARFVARRADIVPEVVAAAREGDLVLVMGARDPSLTGFCQAIVSEMAAGG